MPTDTSEQGLEIRICDLLQESGWLQGDNQDYNAASCVDLAPPGRLPAGHPAGDRPGPQPGLRQQHHKPDLVTLYSDKSLPFSDHIHFRLADYREVIDRVANDDLLVGPYLLRQAVTLMGKAANVQDPQTPEEKRSHADLLRTINGLMADAWTLVYALERSEKIEIKPLALDCYEELCDGKFRRYDRFSNWKEFMDGYPEQWDLASFIPRILHSM